MKISRTSWLILVAGVFVVALASLGIAHAQQIEEQGQLDEELTVAEKRLTNLELKGLSSQKMEMEKQLEQTVSELETIQDNINYPIESIQETDILFDIAEACDVTVTDMTSSALGGEQLASIDCSVITLTAKVEGDVADLIDFVIKLNNDFTTGMIKSADIIIPEDSDEAEESPSAYIRMVVYSYE